MSVKALYENEGKPSHDNSENYIWEVFKNWMIIIVLETRNIISHTLNVNGETDESMGFRALQDTSSFPAGHRINGKFKILN